MASYTRDDAITLVYRMLRDTGNTATEQLLTNTEIGQHVDAAVRDYSHVKPNTKVEDITADGSAYTTLPTAFDVDFSSIVAVETPTGTNPPSTRDGRAYRLYQSPTGWQLMWIDVYPNSGDAVRFTYTIPRVLGTLATDTTVPDVDFDAVGALAASKCALAIAAKYARTSEPILSADTVQYRTKTDEWTNIARRWENIWRDHAKSFATPGSGWVNWDSKLSMNGFDNLTHPRRWR